MIDINEDEVIDGILRRDENVIKMFYKKLRRPFLVTLHSYKIDQESMKDIYQESILVFLDNVVSGKYNAKVGGLTSYLFGIGKYKALGVLRTRKRNAERVEEWHIEENYEVNTDLSEEQKKLKIKFEQLGPKCREILTLFYYRGLSVEDIVNVANYKNMNVVKSQKSRCLKQLKIMVNN